jgi:thiol-disulfide isomerase/thioredoxin
MESYHKDPSAREIWIAVIAGIIGMTAMILFSGTWQVTGEDGLKGQPAPEIEFEAENGKNMSVSKQRGTVVLLNFWTSWCQPCMEEMPSLRALENHFEKAGLLVLAFNLEENAENIKGKLKSEEFPRNIIYNFKKEYLRPYRVNSIPLSVLIDKQGVVRNVYQGPRNWVSIESIKEIEELLR